MMRRTAAILCFTWALLLVWLGSRRIQSGMVVFGIFDYLVATYDVFIGGKMLRWW